MTWISHAIDCKIFGDKAGGHHITNLIFHIANTLLLFYVFLMMTDSTGSPQADSIWKSAFVAALFALHPLHVESVAWISERKDVLSTFFWILTMWAYVRYVRSAERAVIGNYLLFLLLFTLGMMSKPMLVTMPFLLLLIDYWPLNRLPIADCRLSIENQKLKIVSWKWAIIEKAPLLAIGAVLSVVAYIVQKQGSGIPKEGTGFELQNRIANALISYIQYIIKMIWPANLAMFYPHPRQNVSFFYAAVCAVILIAISIAVIRFSKKHRYLFTGWFWYLGTLVPVIGIVQVGEHAMADRYSYITLTGLFIIIAWGTTELLERFRYRNIILWSSSLLILLVLAVCAHIQTGYWKNTKTLCEHALKVTKDNYKAHFCITIPLLNEERYEEVISHCQEAIREKPDHFEAYNNMAIALYKTGKTDEAIACDEYIVEKRPHDFISRGNLASLLMGTGRYDEAITQCRIALEDMDIITTRKTLAKSLLKTGNYSEAAEEYRRIMATEPNDPNIMNKYGNALVHSRKYDEAILLSEKSIKKAPQLPEGYLNMGFALIGKEQYPRAAMEYEKGLAIEPNNSVAQSEAGVAYYKMGKIDDAISHFKKALSIDPNNMAAIQNLEAAVSQQQLTKTK
jgi:tetratricopeptide (TPR) repeat protein